MDHHMSIVSLDSRATCMQLPRISGLNQEARSQSVLQLVTTLAREGCSECYIEILHLDVIEVLPSVLFRGRKEG